MNRIPANFKGKTNGDCPLCEEEDEEEGDLEHYFTCKITRQIAEAWGVEKGDIYSRDLVKMKDSEIHGESGDVVESCRIGRSK